MKLINDLLLLNELDVAVKLTRFLTANIFAVFHLVFEMHSHFVQADLDSLLQYFNFGPLLLIGDCLLPQAFFSIHAAFLVILDEQFDLILSQQSLAELAISLFCLLNLGGHLL